MGFCVFFVCMILLEPVGLNSRSLAQACPGAVLSLEQGLTFCFILYYCAYASAINQAVGFVLYHVAHSSYTDLVGYNMLLLVPL